MRKFFLYYLPSLLWMGFIFYLSSRHQTITTHVYAYDFMTLKTFHIIEYFILNFLVFRSLYFRNNKKNMKQAIYVATVFSVLFAFSDEVHQVFVMNRTGCFRDTLIDSIGIAINYVIVLKYKNTIKKNIC